MKKLILCLILGIMLIGLASAGDLTSLDNEKNVSADNKTIVYYDKGQTGDDTVLATFELKTEHIQQVGLGYQKVFEYTITNSFDDVEKMIGETNYYNVKKGMKPIEVDVDLKYAVYHEIDVNDTETICDDKIELDNDEGLFPCHEVVIGSHKEIVTEYLNYTPRTIVKGETITISGWTDVKLGDKIEWITTFYEDMFEATEWATWSGNLSTNLLAYWRADGNYTDELGNNDGTNQGTDNVSGKIMYAWDFEKDDSDYVSVGSDPLNITTSNLSINAWVKIQQQPSVPAYTVNIMAGGTGSYSFYYHKTGDVLTFGKIGVDEDKTNNATLTTDWAMATVVYDQSANLLHFYINGTLWDTIGASYTFNASSEYYIGKHNYHGGAGGYWDGTMDEIAVWNRALSSEDIIYLYNGGAGCSYNDETCYSTVLEATLYNPIDYANLSDTNVVFNCSGYSEIDDPLTNISLIINATYNNTNSSPANNTNVTNTVPLADGYYNWTCEVCDSTACNNATERTFWIDTTIPTITNHYPTGIVEYQAENSNITLNYTITDTNIDSCWYDLAGTNITLNCSTNSSMNITNINMDNITLWANDTHGNYNSLAVNWDYGIYLNSINYNTTTYETAYETYYINVTANSSLTAVSMIYNTTEFTMDSEGSGIWNYSYAVPESMQGNNSITFNFTYSGSETTSGVDGYQIVGDTSFYKCVNLSTNTTYLNITFKDEADLSVINASIPLSTFVYYLGNGTVNKTLTFTNTTDNFYYEFCASPDTRNLNVVPYIQYEQDSDYPQRTWNPTVQIFNNTIINQTLYLLNSADGIYVTFQVVTYSNQPLEDVEVKAERTISGSNVIVGQGTTGADGSVTFWLNPNFIHDFTFEKSGYDDYETSFAPTQTSYTITMGGGVDTTPSYFRGIDYSILPVISSLVNDTEYTFGFNLTTNYWALDEYGFNLRLRNGTTITGGSTSTNNTQLTLVYNTTNQTKIYMDFYWLINSTYTNLSREWNVYNTGTTQWSISTFFTDLNTYMDSGLFGLDDFGKYLIAFIIILISVGVVSYKYGITSPLAVLSIIFLIIFFLDVVIGLIPTISVFSGYEIPHLLTFLAGIILTIAILREVQRA